MSNEYCKCKDCGVSLKPNAEVCPVCGVRTTSEPDVDLMLHEEYLNPVGNQVPETYPGY